MLPSLVELKIELEMHVEFMSTLASTRQFNSVEFVIVLKLFTELLTLLAVLLLLVSETLSRTLLLLTEFTLKTRILVLLTHVLF